MLLALSLVGAASYVEPPLHLRTDLFAGYNSRSLGVRVTGFGEVMSQETDSRLFGRMHLRLGAGADLAPSHVRGFVQLDWLPIQVLRLRADAGFLRSFGWVGIAGFSARDVDWSEEALYGGDCSLTKLGCDLHRAMTGMDFRAAPELRLRAGPLVLVSTLELHYYSLETPYAYIYDPWYKVLRRSDGWLLYERAVLGALLVDKPDESLLVGLAWEYRDTLGDPTENQRVALTGVWQPRWAEGAMRGAAVVAFLGIHVVDRYVALEPYAVLALSSTWSL